MAKRPAVGVPVLLDDSTNLWFLSEWSSAARLVITQQMPLDFLWFTVSTTMHLKLTLAFSLSLLIPWLCIRPIMAGEDRIAGRPEGPWRRLFLDATVVEERVNVKRVFHTVTKHPRNPLLIKDRAWEGAGPYLYGTVLHRDGRLRMWYHHQNPGGTWNSYAESQDGLLWTKPSLGLIDYQGSKQNNLFATRSVGLSPKPPFDFGQCHNPSVIYQPWHRDPQKRYALYCFSYEFYVPRVAFSPDGLKWTFAQLKDGQGLFRCGDVVNVFHDPYRGRYVATWKTVTARGRAVGVATSADGLAWTKPAPDAVMFADDLDPDATQLYGMPVFPYQGYYLGLPWIYHARWPKDRRATNEALGTAEKNSPCTMDVQFAWSRDLIHWNRTPARPSFIPPGRAGDFDASMVCSARAPVVVGDKLYFYYGGWKRPHNTPVSKNSAAIGLATLRLDGFCSMRAGSSEGHLITRAENLETPSVTINARTHADGHVVAEIVDVMGRTLKGFSRAECLQFQGDQVRHLLGWQTKAFTPQQQATEKRLRFYLRNADLYSYLAVDPSQANTVIYDPTADGGRLPSDRRTRASQRFKMVGRPSGYSLAREDSLTYLDLHSVGGAKTSAAFSKEANWNDATNWCLEMWARIADQGTEPHYGFATPMQPADGRNVSLYLSSKAVGLMTTKGAQHIVLKSVPLDTKAAFRWYRVTHAGGRSGTVTLAVDGKELIKLPFHEFQVRDQTLTNIAFGPNAASQEGRMHVAKFGYRLGTTESLLGPFKR